MRLINLRNPTFLMIIVVVALCVLADFWRPLANPAPAPTPTAVVRASAPLHQTTPPTPSRTPAPAPAPTLSVGWWQGASAWELLPDHLSLSPAEGYPCALLAELPEEDIRLYGLTEDGMPLGILLRRGDALSYYSQFYLGRAEQRAAPLLQVSDFDGDGVAEVGVIYDLSSPAQILQELHFYRPSDTGWTDIGLDKTACLKTLDPLLAAEDLGGAQSIQESGFSFQGTSVDADLTVATSGGPVRVTANAVLVGGEIKLEKIQISAIDTAG